MGKRIILEKPYAYLCDYRHNVGDIIINIIGFVPLGYLLAVHLVKAGYGVLGSGLHSCIEDLYQLVSGKRGQAPFEV